MHRTQLVAALLICAVIGLPRVGSAQSAPPPTILNVTMNPTADHITISGTGFGPAPVVTIDGQPVQLLPGGSDTRLDVLAPAAVLTTPGSYRLTVVDPVRQVGEAFVIAIHPGIVAPVAGIASETPAAAPGGATRLAAPLAIGLAGITAPQPLDSPVTLTGFEDSGSPYRTAVGFQALSSNTVGGGLYNTASGYQALFSNTTGNYNTASGVSALYSNTTGTDNTASGAFALSANTTGFYNTASGFLALSANTTGNYNTAIGNQAFGSNTTGSQNMASGAGALFSNSTGASNTGLGTNAGFYATTGSYNVFLGADVTGTAADTNTIRLGLPYTAGTGQNQTFIAGIYGTAVTNWLPVVIDATGKLGTVNPQTGGGKPAPLSSTDVTVVQLRQEVREQQATIAAQGAAIADLSARFARLEALVRSSTGGK